MPRVFPISRHARLGATRLALAGCAAALLVAGAIAPASAATVLSTTGQVGSISVVDTAADPGVTCTSVRSLFSADPTLASISLHGPIVDPIVHISGDHVLIPALVSVDFRVYQPLLGIRGEPAGSRLVLSAVHQVLATSLAGTKVPDHTFDAGGLPNGRYTAQLVVTYKSTDQAITYGSRVIQYDVYKSVVSEYSLALGRFIERVVGVGSTC